MSKFVHLHVHSHGSLQDGACSEKAIVEQAVVLGMPAVALTDHGRCSGLLRLKKECQKNNVKPLFGLEAYVAPGEHTLKEKVEGENTSYHLTLLAKNNEGLKNLFRLSSLGWLEGYYYKPRCSVELLSKYREGLIVLSGCSSGKISNRFLEGREEEAIQHAKLLHKIFRDDFYIEVQNHGMEWQGPLKRWLFKLSFLLDVPIVATQDSHYIHREDAALHQKICKLAAGDLEFGTTEMHFKSYAEMCERFDAEEQFALAETASVAEKCNVNWDYGRTIWPVFPLPKEETPEYKLQVLANTQLKVLFKQPTQEYLDRLEYELNVIKKMEFATYFLVVADFITWAKQHNIPVGPGRGSGSGSLVCYCLGITEVDPLKHGLYFERFLNPSRVSLPDLDIDFCPRGRKEVMSYVGEKYGHNRVAQIGTYSQFKPRGALRDFARVCGYEPAIGAKLAELVPPDIAGKALTFDEVIVAEPGILSTQWPEVVELARKAEGLYTKAGVHAAGVVISDSEIMSQVPLFRGRNDEVATQFDMHDVEEIGLVKYDFLGLINLTIIHDALQLIKENYSKEINLRAIDYNDQKVYENIFHTGLLDGVFQFETSSGFRELCIRVRPTSVEDLSTITALFRPGPIGTGLLNKYVEGRNGGRVEFPIPELEPVLQETYGVLVYQEQVMRICTDLAGYTASEADNMRRVIGKKDKEKMRVERIKFVSGCIKNGIREDIATKLFDDVEGFALYSFNRSHSVAYSIISYRTAWLKHYYPEEFYCSLFNNTIKEQDQLVKYIYACKERGIAVEPPDINRSGALFTIDNGTIRFGLGGIKGIGEKACAQILESRTREFASLEELVKAGAGAKDVKALVLSGALEGITEYSRQSIVENVEELIKYYKKLASWEDRKQRIADREQEIQAAIKAGHKPPRRLPKLSEPPVAPELTKTTTITKEERLRLEREVLGFYVSGHPLDSYPDLYRLAPTSLADIINNSDNSMNGTIVRFPAIVSTLIKKRTRKGKDMAVLHVEDKAARSEVTIFPSTWTKQKNKVAEKAVAILTCRVNKEQTDDGITITNLVLSDFQAIDSSLAFEPVSTRDLFMTLKDGSVIKFLVSGKTSKDGWQRANAILNNLETRP